MTELLIGLATTLIAATSTYFIGKRKTAAEVRKLNAEAAKLEVDRKLDEAELFEKINAVLIEQNERNEKYIKQLEDRIVELEEMIRTLHGKQCMGDLCPTKMEYNKIMAKRAARKASVVRRSKDL